jgi:hypothetical protein
MWVGIIAGIAMVPDRNPKPGRAPLPVLYSAYVKFWIRPIVAGVLK